MIFCRGKPKFCSPWDEHARRSFCGKWAAPSRAGPPIVRANLDEVYDFLWYLLRHLRGHVIVVWDGASIHDPRSLSEFCRQYPRLHLERLPAYAPQLNPIEAAWHALKHQ